MNLAGRAPDFATWKRRRDKDDVSLPQERRRSQRREGKRGPTKRSEGTREFREGATCEEEANKGGGRKGKDNSNERNEKKKEDMSAVESALDVLSRAATMLQEERPKVTNLHRKPSSAWRKERRRDPIQSEALDMSAGRTNHHSRPSVIVPAAPQVGIEDTTEMPATTSTVASGGKRTGMRKAGGVSDPAIDEHFKRSLGPKKYAAVFNATNADKEAGLSVDDHFAKALGETWTRLQANNQNKDST
ncbi:hypothetical protein PUN28_015961 [Cardiocondyla obscurior]|uniref:Transcription cofactor vestigial-like protein 4 n=1 Tax=Cardiocondyla obscurior TaxID=286306 RepID=A0AAW2EQB1_9HYME